MSWRRVSGRVLPSVGTGLTARRQPQSPRPSFRCGSWMIGAEGPLLPNGSGPWPAAVPQIIGAERGYRSFLEHALARQRVGDDGACGPKRARQNFRRPNRAVRFARTLRWSKGDSNCWSLLRRFRPSHCSGPTATSPPGRWSRPRRLIASNLSVCICTPSANSSPRSSTASGSWPEVSRGRAGRRAGRVLRGPRD